MPIYEYLCGSCQHRFEKLVRGESEIRCPVCGGPAQRTVSLPAATATDGGSCAPRSGFS